MINISPLIIVITYNPNINIIDKMIYNEFSYLIIDSSEIPNQDITDLYSKYKINFILNKENLGIAKALNIGCRYAIEHDHKWAITMDQDSILTKNIVSRLLDYKDSHNNIAIISPTHSLQNGNMYYQIRNCLHLCSIYKESYPKVKEIKNNMCYKNIIKSILFEKEKIKKLYAIFLAFHHYKRGFLGKLKNNKICIK